MRARTRLAQDPFRPDEELAGFIAGLEGDGAVVSFTGLARPADAEGHDVSGLFLDAYPGMTEASLETIARDALDRFTVSAVSLVAMAPANYGAVGGSVEVHADAPTGPLLGATEAIKPATGATPAPTPIRATLTPTSGVHDLYLVFRNDQAPAGQMLFIVLTATFEGGGAGPATGSR